MDHFRTFFQGDAERLAEVEWDVWLNRPGLPPFDPRGVLDMSIADRTRGPPPPPPHISTAAVCL